jgi:ribosomal protein L30E
MAINTGRLHLGSKVAIRELQRGRAKIAILSSNCSDEIREQIEKYGKLGNIPVLQHQKGNWRLKDTRFGEHRECSVTSR